MGPTKEIEQPIKVFISHSTKDEEITYRLSQDLLLAGFDVLVDQLLVKPGQEWRQLMLNALKSADVVIVVITENSMQSPFVMSEIGTARAYMDEGTNRKLLLPVVYGDIEVPYVISDLQSMRLTDETYEATLLEIRFAIKKFNLERSAGHQEALLRITEVWKSKHTTLDLGNCGLAKIPDIITELTWLEELIMAGTSYYDFSLGTIVRPVYTNAGENTGAELPFNLGKLTKLKKLVIAGLGTYTLRPEDMAEISKLPSLEILIIEMLGIGDISYLASLSGLKVLSIYGNAVSDIRPVQALRELEKLDISGNPISELDALSELTKLTILSFYRTNVHSLDPISRLERLTELNFANSSVSDLAVLRRFRSLQKLYFANCKVLLLRPIIDIASLQLFDADRCPIEDVPADIYESGDPKKLRAYFEGLKSTGAFQPSFGPPKSALEDASDDDAPLERDVKLIILGNSNTGKTNLVEYLRSNNFIGKRNTTHGLEVQRWYPDPARFPELKDITVSVWDFGGQEYYHGAYRLFLSSNAVYVLLWCNDETNVNGRRKTKLYDNQEPVDLEHFEIKYWLDTIRHYSGDKSKVLILVQNKTDVNPKKRVDQELHDEYKILDSFHISLREGSNQQNHTYYYSLQLFLAELQSLISSNADKATIPPHWQRVRNEIIALKEEDAGNNKFLPFIKNDLWITLADFAIACRDLTADLITQDEIDTLPGWLDRGGTVVYLPAIFKDRIFLRPDLLAKKIYEVLNEQVYAKKGEFQATDIPMGQNNEMRDIFIEIAKHLELIFPHPVKGKENYFIAPQYLPDQHPIEDLFKIATKGVWESSLWIKVPLFFYKKVLHGLLLHFARDKDTQCSYLWKHGLMFMKNNLRVIIKGLYPNEDERDGTILLGVEKNPTSQPALQKEIFNKILEIFKEGQGSSNAGTKSQKETPTTNVQDEQYHTEIKLSYDGTNFVSYAALRTVQEPKIKAENSEAWLITQNFSAVLPFTPPKAKRVFLSYSHQNTKWLHRINTHLAGLRRSKEIETWDDKEIMAGDMWDSSIRKKLDEADVYILLLSADFIASNYIWNTELKAAFDSFKQRNATLIPILLEPFDLGALPNVSLATDTASYKISDFEIIPKNDMERLTAVSVWQNQEDALAKVAQRIREVIQKR